MDHAAFLELTAGRALDDLDWSERLLIEPHLAGCDSCRKAAGDLDEVLRDLCLAVPQRTAPPELRASVVAALANEMIGTRAGIAPSSPAALAPARPRPRPTRLRLLTWPRLAAAGAALAILVAAGLGASVLQLRSELDASRAQLAAVRADLAATRGTLAGLQSRLSLGSEALMASLDPAHRVAALHSEALAGAARAWVVWVPGSDRSFLMADGLPATPPGMVYELWYADGSGAHGGAVLAHDGSGPFIASFRVDLSGKAATMVTLEPAGGATGEPGPQVVFGELPSR